MNVATRLDQSTGTCGSVGPPKDKGQAGRTKVNWKYLKNERVFTLERLAPDQPRKPLVIAGRPNSDPPRM